MKWLFEELKDIEDDEEDELEVPVSMSRSQINQAPVRSGAMTESEDLEEYKKYREESKTRGIRPMSFTSWRDLIRSAKKVGMYNEDFNIGKSVEWRKSKFKWSLTERVLNAVISRLNKDYYLWKGNIKWYQERNGRWNLYVIDPGGMDQYVRQIEQDIKAYSF